MFFLLKDTLRPLRKELKMAGVDSSKVKQWQKIYEKVRRQSPQIEHHYIRVKNDLKELESMLKKLENDLIYGKEQNSFAWRNAIQVLDKKLKNYGMWFKNYENSFDHDFLIGKADTEFHLTYATLLELCMQGLTQEIEVILMQSEVENLMAFVQEALQKPCPNFKALTFFLLEHSEEELEELPHLEKLNTILALYEEQFLDPMKQLLLQAFENTNAKMPILSEKSDLKPEERATYILEEKVWNLS